MEFQVSLNENFMKDFTALNIIIFANIARREKKGVSWDVKRISSS